MASAGWHRASGFNNQEKGYKQMKNIITGKVLTKKDGSFKTFQYELDGKVLRKSHRFYPRAFDYGKGGWTLGRTQTATWQTGLGMRLTRLFGTWRTRRLHTFQRRQGGQADSVRHHYKCYRT